MAKAQPLTIGGLQFASKTAAERHLSCVLNRYRPSERVNDEDAAMLQDLLTRHPDREQKLRGLAVSHFEVHPFEGGTLCFFLVRSDGTKEHFSFKKCIINSANRR